jgi:hypothetical protein
MTNYEAIKGMTEKEMARFLMIIDINSSVPKLWSCNELNCINCKEDLSCYRDWLNKEVREDDRERKE